MGAMSSNESLIVAVWDERADLVQAALLEGADVEAREDGKTALMWATMSGCSETVKSLIRHGANVGAQTEDGSTALMTAAFASYVDIVDSICFSGAALHQI